MPYVNSKTRQIKSIKKKPIEATIPRTVRMFFLIRSVFLALTSVEIELKESLLPICRPQKLHLFSFLLILVPHLGHLTSISSFLLLEVYSISSIKPNFKFSGDY